MSTDPDCKAIEKGLKDIIFGMSSGVSNFPPVINPGPQLSNFSSDKQFPEDDKPKFRDKGAKDAFLMSNSSSLLINQSNSSNLIDLNALSEFTAKHIDSGFEIPETEIKLPHPDMEDDNLASVSSSGISVLFEEIKKSSNYLNLPENPLQPSKPQSIEKQIYKKRTERCVSQALAKKKKRRKKNSRKSKEGEDDELPEAIINEVSKDITVLDKEKNEEITYIKTKNRVFPSIGREYSLSLEKEIFRFNCHTCNYNNDTSTTVKKHLSSSPHLKQKELTDKDMMLPFLPEPLPAQIEAINEMITLAALKSGLSNEDLNARKVIKDKLSAFVQDNVPICSVHLIGSSAYGIGLKTSEVDFVFKVAEDEKIPDALEALFDALSKNSAFERVIADFHRKRPQIRFTDPDSKLTCNILIDNVSGLKLASLLSFYCKLDSRVQLLGSAVRYWAKLCDIDKEEVGTFPSFSFALLVIHFLQQVQPPVLPVIHEVKHFNASSKFYEKYLKEKLWKSQNTDSVGLLWLKFLRFYNFDYNLGESVVCIRYFKRGTCAERNWSTKFYAIEEPTSKRNLAYVIPNFAVCNFIRNCFLTTYRYFAYPQMKTGFSEIQLLKTDDFDPLKITEYVKNPIFKEDESDDSGVSENEDSTIDLLNVCQDLEDHDPDIAVEDLISTMSNMILDEEKSESDKIILEKSPESPTESENLNSDLTETVSEIKVAEETVKESKNKQLTKQNKQIPICFWDDKEVTLSKDMFHYKLNAFLLKGDKDVPLVCKICKNCGHIKKDCPVEEIRPPPELPLMTPEFLECIQHVLSEIWDRNSVSEKRLKEIECEMRDIESSIKEVFPNAKLSLFGSFCNGFGFRDVSDLDFCLTFNDLEDGKSLDSTDVIHKVAYQLKKHPKLENVISITSAKVPIVKFARKDIGLEGDISLYNTLALNNTEMLDVYSRIDERVKILGYALKYFAKTLGICDASRGSLSSYAYILMVLYFLQQTNPPVIPVLQELHDGEKPEKLIDGWNVWFYKDIDKLNEVWPDFGKNKESAAQLWLSLLAFYARDFDWDEFVISIKQKNTLKRFKKLWISDVLAIEDPFDLNHNLGGGLSRKMNTYIIKTFIKGLIRFGTPLMPDKMLTISKNKMEYFFDRTFLNNGCEPPHDRGCGNCGKIGHVRKDCPQEKTCSYCRKPGHLLRTCPRRNKHFKDGKNNRRNNNFKFDSPKRERKGLNEASQNQAMLPPPQALRNDISRTFPGMQSNSQMVEATQRKLLQIGMPLHRLPPPGFSGSGRPTANPPPGFKTNSQMLSQTANHPSPFPHIPPFPRQMNKDLHSQSPPKHYSSSPPKKFQGGSVYQRIPANQGWPVNSRNAGMQVERHPNPQYNQGSSRSNWQQHSMQRENQGQHKFNHHQGADRRQNRTNSDHHLYNSNLQDRWYPH